MLPEIGQVMGENSGIVGIMFEWKGGCAILGV